MYSIFWVVPGRLNIMCRRFGTLCQFHLHRWWRWNCSETSAHKIQTPGNHPKDRIQRLSYSLSACETRSVKMEKSVPKRLHINFRRRGIIQKKEYNACPILYRLAKHTTHEDGKECSETSAHKIRTPGNHLKERIQHSEHGEILKSIIKYRFLGYLLGPLDHIFTLSTCYIWL